MLRRRVALAALLLSGGFVASAFAQGSEKRQPIETFSAFAANMQRGRASSVTINIYRWSTDEERETLLTTLQEFGRDKLIGTLMKIRPTVGYMRTPNSIGYDLYYARNNPSPAPDGGRHVVLATNRRVAMGEAYNNTRSMQYQLTVIELHLDKDGKGEGTMVPAAKISWDKAKKSIEIENFSAQPVLLQNVTAKTP